MPLEAAPVRPVHGSACEDTVTDSGQGNTAQGQAAMQEQRLRQIVDQATDTFIVIDAAGCIADVNAHGCQNLGYAREQLIGRPYALLDPLQPPARLAELTTALATGPLTIETHHRRSDGSELPVEVRFGALATGDGPCLLAICRDISERRALEAQLRFQSTHDLLTGLPNRNLLEDRLNMAVAHARRRSRLVGVLCLDLIRFKQLVDTLGHTATDELLRQIARRLIGVVRPGDTVSRQAGDTFVIVLNELVAEERASQIAGRLREAVTTPLTVAGQEVYPDASIGIAVFPRDGSDCDTLLRHAAAAMQRARQHPRNEPQFYAAAMNTWATERLGLEGKLRRALDGRELLLHYQPQIELSTGHIVGTEALLRWRHPELGMVSPAEFIPLAEETGLILPIGDWVLRTACAQARAWRDAGLPELRMCVNLSALQFAQPDLATRVAAVLAETGLPATALELEITESVLMRDVEAAAAMIGTLNDMGVQLALDDFGTGYSSLAYLKRFRIQRLKIDRSFVRDITTDPDDAAITLAVIALAHSLRKSVIAEGVETEEQRHFLSERGCDEVQGFYFSRPLPAEELTELLAGRRALANGLGGTETEEPPTVLLVDDDPVFTTFGCSVLRNEACRVLSARSGREALDLLARNRVDVIVSDQVMPEMDGADFLRRTRALYPNACRIMLSGSTSLQSLISSINEGGIHKFLEKPVTPERLRTTVREALARRTPPTG